jgi:signal transduction histidine kinase/ActR/RegA family two-component response regulator
LARPAILIALTAILPLVVYASFDAYVSLRGRRVGSDRQAVNIARSLSQGIDRDILSGLDEAQILASTPALDTVGGSRAAFEEMARRTQARHRDWLAVILLAPDGRWLFNTEQPVNGRSAMDMDSLLQTVRTAHPAAGDLIRDAKGQWGIPLRAPVIRDGKVVSVVTIVIQPLGINRMLGELGIPQGWIVAVANSEGRIVARSEAQDRALGLLLNAQALEVRARGGGGVYRGRTLDAVPTESAYWVSPSTHWSVHIGIPLDIYEAPVRQMALTMLVGFGLCLLLALALFILWLRDFESRRSHTAAVEQATRIDALGRLTGGVAHDFNNLLTVIQGNAEILGRRLKDMPQAERSLSAIRTATDRAAKLTRQLLVFARGGPSGPVAVDLARKVTELMAAMEQLVGSGVVIATAIDAAAPPVSVDPLQLEAALLNLAANARDAMAGVGRIEIGLRRQGAWVALIVRDEGPGFDPAVLARVFDPFFTTKPVGQGTGLGLSQVYGLMKGVGGEVRAANAPDGGGMVTLLFPPSAEAPEPIEDLVLSLSPAAGALEGVLLVDDNEAVRATTAAFLRECGLSVIEATDARRALALLETAQVEAVISDILMPGEMDGIALAEAIRKRWPDLPVMLVSGYSERAAEAQGRGFSVLNKPYSLPELEARLRALVERTRVDETCA